VPATVRTFPEVLTIMTFDAHNWARLWSPGSGPTKGGDVAAMYAEGAERWDTSIDARVSGREAIVAFADSFLAAVPDSVCEVRAVTQTADTCVIEWTWHGTHTGDAEGWLARGETLKVPGVNVIRLDGDLIAGETSYWDRAAMFAAET
jgi:steroid delta-isomerase-like uncharacterized protein